MSEVLIMVGKTCMDKEYCFKEVQGVNMGVVQIQVEALHEEQTGCVVRSGRVF